MTFYFEWYSILREISFEVTFNFVWHLIFIDKIWRIWGTVNYQSMNVWVSHWVSIIRTRDASASKNLVTAGLLDPKPRLSRQSVCDINIVYFSDLTSVLVFVLKLNTNENKFWVVHHQGYHIIFQIGFQQTHWNQGCSINNGIDFLGRLLTF